jgi:hypothetical protein
MLTININDLNLEKQLTDKARSTGKSMQEIIKQLLKELPEKSSDLNYEILDPKEYGYYIITPEPNIADDAQ